MTILPIAERELRVAARRPSTYWFRFAFALGLLLVATWIFGVASRESQRGAGMGIFYMLAGALTVYALTAGVRSTADCLSEEKREGTLGLLFLTDLRGYDVVAGKLLANSLTVFYALLAVLPILALPLLMGGITGAEVGRLALVLVNTLFFSLSAGMCASALCKNSRAATFATLGLILLVTAGGPALGLLEFKLRHYLGNYPVAFLLPSPVFSFFSGVDHFYNSGFGKGFYWSVGIVHACGWIFLAVASWWVRKSWQDRPVTVRGARWRGRWQGIFEGGPAGRLQFRTKMLDLNPFCWLAARPRQKAYLAWTPLVLAALAWLWGWYKLGEDWFNPGIYVATAVLLGVTLKAMIGAEAGRRLLEDRKIGSLELLLSTPLSVREILRGQALALWHQFGGPVLTLFLVAIFMLLAGAYSHVTGANERPYWFGVGIGGMVMFVADAVALYWVGMWFGLSVKNPKHAFGAAILPILVVPWIGVAGVMTLFGILVPPQHMHNFRPENWVWGMWFGFSMVLDIGFGLMARHALLRRFRELATQRFQIKPSLWRRLFKS